MLDITLTNLQPTSNLQLLTILQLITVKWRILAGPPPGMLWWTNLALENPPFCSWFSKLVSYQKMVIFQLASQVRSPECNHSMPHSLHRGLLWLAECMAAAMGIPTRLPTLIREHRNGAYGVSWRRNAPGVMGYGWPSWWWVGVDQLQKWRLEVRSDTFSRKIRWLRIKKLRIQLRS